MSLIKSSEEIELIRESALLVSKTLGMLTKEIKPGINTLYLDKLAEIFIRDHNAEPGFLGLYDFPNTLCISPNSQVVHGIPNKEELQNHRFSKLCRFLLLLKYRLIHVLGHDYIKQYQNHFLKMAYYKYHP